MHSEASAATALPSAEQAASDVARQLLIGQQYLAEGRIGPAIAAYQSGLDSAAIAGTSQIATEILAELHAKLGNAYMVGRQFGSATEAYRSALRLRPSLTACWCNLGNAQLELGNVQAAVTLYVEALKLDPAHWPSLTNLVHALMAARQFEMAKGLLTDLVAARPQDGTLHHQLGKVSFELNDMEAALMHFQAALEINPRDAESLYWTGAIRQKLDDNEAAQAAYAAAARIQPLIRRSAAKAPAEFRVLALYAPFAGNTPAEYLFSQAAHDTDTLSLLEDSEVDIAGLGEVQLVVNLISDADQGGAVLPLAARLAASLGKPVINDPAKIQRTTRDAVADLLPGIAGCRIPRIMRLAAQSDVSATTLAKLLPFSFPVLARPAGTHGGDDFEKIGDLEALARFLSEQPDSDHYVIEYVDTASADGHFRKYRFIYVGGQVLPYHLAIGADWKLHHDNTDMATHAWMQEEEAAFLNAPTSVFSAENYRALDAIRERIGLDFFGIDCGLDRDGNLVVFEVNASMLVHNDNPDFPYKAPAVQAIKQAFDKMLRERAGV
ncbi:MAG TPA: tetratricopeptide repeat protein [Bradyrhizobium sp.]|nr:tetratricopeptide repeat protein [Bradyrhizobium sp.]